METERQKWRDNILDEFSGMKEKQFCTLIDKYNICINKNLFLWNGYLT